MHLPPVFQRQILNVFRKRLGFRQRFQQWRKLCHFRLELGQFILATLPHLRFAHTCVKPGGDIVIGRKRQTVAG